MKTDLDLLIEMLEGEKLRLEKTINECVKERDYLYANYQEKALQKVRGKLDYLYKMKMPFYDEVVKLDRMKSTAYKPQKDDLYKFLADFYKKDIEEQELKVKQLKEKKSEPFYDGQLIDDALFDLVERKLKGFRLCFREEPEICIEFQLNDGFIEIALPTDMNLNEFDPKDDENWNHIGVFVGLGFKSDENNRLVYKYPVSKFKDAIGIKIMLSRLLYDAFWYNDKWDSARLIYSD